MLLFFVGISVFFFTPLIAGVSCKIQISKPSCDELFSSIEAEATFAINEAMSSLYHEGVFIKAVQAKVIASRGLEFLRLYANLAQICFSKRMKRFPLAPKGHYMHHQFLTLYHQSQTSDWCLNLLVFGVQLEEDYIGKPSRLARRVSSKTTSLRVIQRTFLAVKTALGVSPDGK